MRAESKRLLEDFLTYQEYHLDEAVRAWDTTHKRIIANPNQMNVFGVWQDEQLHDLLKLRVVVLERQRAVEELRNFINKPKPRFRYLKKVPKKARNKKPAKL